MPPPSFTIPQPVFVTLEAIFSGDQETLQLLHTQLRTFTTPPETQPQPVSFSSPPVVAADFYEDAIVLPSS